MSPPPDVGMGDAADSQSGRSAGRESTSAEVESRDTSHLTDVNNEGDSTSPGKANLNEDLADGTDDRDLQLQLTGELLHHSVQKEDQVASRTTSLDDSAGNRNDHLQAYREPRNDVQTSIAAEHSRDLDASAAPRPAGKSIEQESLRNVRAVSSTNIATNGHNSEDALSSVERGRDASSASPRLERESVPNETQHKGGETELRPKEKLASSGTSYKAKMNIEAASLKTILDTFSPQATQKVLRENWRTFLFENYDLDHISFVLRAGLKNSNSFVWEKLVKDENIFKEPLVEAVSAKLQVRRQVLSRTGASDMLNYVPEAALDEALSYKIRTMPAQKLINWLAEGNRLGFSSDDILEDDESVTPNMLSRPPSRPNLESRHPPAPPAEGDRSVSYQKGLAVPDRDPLLAEQERMAAARSQEAAANHVAPSANGGLRCNKCYLTFLHFSGYNYHVTKNVCQKKRPAEPYKWFCGNCLQGFTTKQGKEYHNMNRVCRTDMIAPATLPSKVAQQPANPNPNPPPLHPYVRTNSNDNRQVTHTLSSTSLPPISSLPVQLDHGSYRSPQTWSRDSRPLLPPILQRPSRNGVSVVGGLLQPQPTTYPPPHVISSHASHSHQLPRPTGSRFEVTIPSPSKSRTEAPAATSASQQSRTPRPAFRRQTPSSDVRTSPSDLPPEKLKELERQLAEADRRYEQGQAAIPDHYTEVERQAKLTGLKNANASRKSQIRKSFGVTLRMREKDKLAKRAVLNASPAVKNGYVPQRVASPQSNPATIHQDSTQTGFSPINRLPHNAPPEGRQSLYADRRSSHSPQNHQGVFVPMRNTASPLSVPHSPRETNQPVIKRIFTPNQYQGPPPKKNPNKRVHESTEHEYRPRISRVSESVRSGLGTGSEESSTASPTEANISHRRTSNTRQEAIYIDDSFSENDGASK